MAELIELRKGLIIWVWYKGRGFETHLLNFTMLHGICFSNIKSLVLPYTHCAPTPEPLLFPPVPLCSPAPVHALLKQLENVNLSIHIYLYIHIYLSIYIYLPIYGSVFSNDYCYLSIFPSCNLTNFFSLCLSIYAQLPQKF